MGNQNFAYLAGLLDGEGTIGIYNESNGKGNPRRTRVRMVITNTSPILMEYLKQTFGVKYVQQKKYYPPRCYPNAKICFHAFFNEHQILVFGEKMLPYLTIKHDKMVDALNYLNNKKLRKKGEWK